MRRGCIYCGCVKRHGLEGVCGPCCHALAVSASSLLKCTRTCTHTHTHTHTHTPHMYTYALSPMGRNVIGLTSHFGSRIVMPTNWCLVDLDHSALMTSSIVILILYIQTSLGWHLTIYYMHIVLYAHTQYTHMYIPETELLSYYIKDPF